MTENSNNWLLKQQHAAVGFNSIYFKQLTRSNIDWKIENRENRELTFAFIFAADVSTAWVTDICRWIPHAKEAEDANDQRRQSYKNQLSSETKWNLTWKGDVSPEKQSPDYVIKIKS